jgi:hypothetical protein
MPDQAYQSLVPTFNGVPITNDEGRFISGQNLSGRESIRFGGLTFSLPPQCQPIRLGYSDGIASLISESCLIGTTVYQAKKSATLGATSGTLLYLDGQCGTTVAPTGYYSDKGNIYYWDGNSLEEYGTCPTYAKFSDITNSLDPGNPADTVQYQYTSSVSDTAKYRFSYITDPGVFVELYWKISTGAEYPNDLDVDTSPPKFLSPPFTLFSGATTGVGSGQYITLGFQSVNLSPGNPIEVTVEVRLPFSNNWYTWASFNISTQ